MTIKTHWYDNTHTTIVTHHSGLWTWEEMHYHDRTEVASMMRNAKCPVAHIIDMLEAFWSMPGELVANLKLAAEAFHDNEIDVVIFVISDEYMAHLILEAHRYFGKPGRRYCRATSMEEALALVADCRAGVG